MTGQDTMIGQDVIPLAGASIEAAEALCWAEEQLDQIDEWDLDAKDREARSAFKDLVAKIRQQVMEFEGFAEKRGVCPAFDTQDPESISTALIELAGRVDELEQQLQGLKEDRLTIAKRLVRVQGRLWSKRGGSRSGGPS